VSEEFVTKQINKLNVKKATGHDGISPKILKMAQQEITNLKLPQYIYYHPKHVSNPQQFF
jgi:hypothetical protein